MLFFLNVLETKDKTLGAFLTLRRPNNLFYVKSVMQKIIYDGTLNFPETFV